MKKSLMAIAALVLTASVHAQSSVTVFGVVDAATRYVNANGQHLKLLGADGFNSSRLGFRGVEDLGGGLKAGFWIESGFNPDTGAQGDANRFWNRRVSVSLSGDFGEVRLGRGKTSTRLVIDDFDPFTTTGLGDVTKLYSTLGSNADTLNRSDNQINYFTPATLGGFYASLDAAAGENANVAAAPSTNVTSGGKKMLGGRLGYKVGGLHVAAALEQTTGAANQKYKLTSLAGSYDFGIVRPSLNLSSTEYAGRKQNIVQAGVTVTMGQSQFLGSYAHAKANNAAKAALTAVDDAKIFALGYVYSLSKRTALYTTYSQISNDGKGTFALVTGSPAPAKGGKSSGFDLGLRHSF